eukprot:UN01195
MSAVFLTLGLNFQYLQMLHRARMFWECEKWSKFTLISCFSTITMQTLISFVSVDEIILPT